MPPIGLPILVCRLLIANGNQPTKSDCLLFSDGSYWKGEWLEMYNTPLRHQLGMYENVAKARLLQQLKHRGPGEQSHFKCHASTAVKDQVAEDLPVTFPGDVY